MLVFCFYKESYAAANQNQDMEDDIGSGHLLHPGRWQGVDDAGNDSKSSHDADCDACSWCFCLVRIITRNKLLASYCVAIDSPYVKLLPMDTAAKRS
jgi:hypothetical protein